VIPELIAAGHQVVGLVRSDASATAVAAAGGTPLRGDLNDLGSLRARAGSPISPPATISPWAETLRMSPRPGG